jgi:hypothetical protein
MVTYDIKLEEKEEFEIQEAEKKTKKQMEHSTF